MEGVIARMPKGALEKLMPKTKELDKKPQTSIFNKNHIGKCQKCEEKDEIINNLELELKSKGNNIVMTKTRIFTNNIKYKINKKTGRFEEDTFRCRYDHHDYTGIAIPLPEFYNNGIYECNHKFCSIECAHTFNILCLNDNKTEGRKRLFIKMIKELYGFGLEERINLREAPPLEILIAYGGSVTIDEFRCKFTSINYDYVIYNPIIKPVAQCIEERRSEIAMQQAKKTN